MSILPNYDFKDLLSKTTVTSFICGATFVSIGWYWYTRSLKKKIVQSQIVQCNHDTASNANDLQRRYDELQKKHE